jgi:CRISPR-associated exonuclease Cas4
MFSESDLLPISGLQHLLFCARQCALIHLDRIWEENRLTAEGRLLHQKAHNEVEETRGNVKTCRGLKIRSMELGLFGVTDVVEFHYTAGYGSRNRELQRIIPVEYKRGKEKEDDCDKVQLCAQAICLEEMLKTNIESGDLYYGSSRRRVVVDFSNELRDRVKNTVKVFHNLVAGMILPSPIEGKQCRSCSLINKCMPELNHKARSALDYLESIYKDFADEAST